MTREEIIEQLNLAIDLIKQDGKDWLDDRDIPMLEECVKALSQEPICDRDCEHCTWTECPIEPCDDVLDKIRAEIELLSNANPSYWHSGDMVEREEVLDIIGKYKGDKE